MLRTEETRGAHEELDMRDRIERAEAAERRERHRRIAAEATAAELAQIAAREIEARRRAEELAGEMAVLLAQRDPAA